MGVKQDMHVFNRAADLRTDGMIVDQILGRDQNLAFAKQKFGQIVPDQHTVLGRQLDVARIAQRTGLDQNRGHRALGRHSAPPDPAHGL